MMHLFDILYRLKFLTLYLMVFVSWIQDTFQACILDDIL